MFSVLGMQYVLGIETSCDETAAAVLRFNGRRFKVLGSAVASQVAIHKLTGGVVPEVAAREHVTTIMPTIKLALEKAGVKKEKLSAVAVTSGPGLLPALMVGVDAANALSMSLNIPVIPVQHITGHIYANSIEHRRNVRPSTSAINNIKFPLLALIVSGGHTEFIKMTDFLKFRKLGRTVDDAAGEAFDKTAKILGLPYPGGPEISKRAALGDSKAFNFPRPMLGEENFSFAGLKTSVLYKVDELTKKKKLNPKQVNDLAASIQEAIIDTIVRKTEKALAKYKVKTFTLGGGVAANSVLRERLAKMIAEKFPEVTNLETKKEYATDNAVMIAAVGAMKLWKKEKQPKFAKANPQWEI